MISNDVFKDLIDAFPGSFSINNQFYTHLNPRIRESFGLRDCETRADVACKVLEWLSYNAFKSNEYKQKWRNDEVHEYHLNGINAFCGTNFTIADIETIYTRLGNGINRKLTLDFIESGYDLSVLTERRSDG